MENSIITFIDYGDIVFDIKTQMDKKGLTINQMVKRTGLHHQVIRRYYEGTVTRYDKDVLCHRLRHQRYYVLPKTK